MKLGMTLGMTQRTLQCFGKFDFGFQDGAKPLRITALLVCNTRNISLQ
jgi:hypothetical protein